MLGCFLNLTLDLLRGYVPLNRGKIAKKIQNGVIFMKIRRRINIPVMKKTAIFLSSPGLLLFGLLSLYGCSKHNSGTEHPVNKVDVYVAGEEFDDSIDEAIYWKNGAAVPLPSPYPFLRSSAVSIAVSGSDVYLAGFAIPKTGSHLSKAVYWKNGVQADLTDGSSMAMALGVKVVGTDVYVAGFSASNDSLNYFATYWKNGQQIYLTDRSEISPDAFSLAVSGSDVYLSGGLGGYLKNGMFVPLNTPGLINVVAVSGSDLYLGGISGTSTGVATYWKNGNMNILPEPASAAGRASNVTCMAVSGSDVYIAGNGYLGASDSIVARYWINGGQPLDINNGGNAAGAVSIAVAGSDVYLAGSRWKSKTSYLVPVYWINGKGTDLGNPARTSSAWEAFGSAIFLVE
jgi:hypothetical protein